MSTEAHANAVWLALSDATRRAILDRLADGPRTTGAIVEQVDHLCRTAVMKHLDVLVSAQLVLVRRDGRMRWNYLNPLPIQEVCDRWVGRHVRHLAAAALRLKDVAEHESRTVDADADADRKEPPRPRDRRKREKRR